jgi:tetratricopeptide (TPR) repeat protein
LSFEVLLEAHLFWLSGPNLAALMNPSQSVRAANAKNSPVRHKPPARLADVRRTLGFLLILIAAFGHANAQDVRHEAYYQSCAKYFGQGDYQTAINQCDIALANKADFAPALRLISRARIALNQLTDAKTSLDKARAVEADNPENDLLEAEIAILQGDANRASSLVTELVSSPNIGFQTRALRLDAKARRLQGRDADAIKVFKRLLALDPNDLETRRFLSSTLLESDPRAAVDLLRQSPDKGSPVFLADMGRAKWIAGDLNGAIENLERAVSSPSAFRNDRSTYTKALGALAYSYFGLGRTTEGYRVLTQIGDPQNLFLSAINHGLPWLLGAIVLLVLHLIGESRIEPLSTIEIQDGPRPWTVTSAYRWLMVAAIAGLLSSVLAGFLLYGNFLAIATPNQASVARDVYFSVFTLVLVGLAVRTAHGLGWNARELLLGITPRALAVDGIALGLVLLILTLGYSFLMHLLRWNSGFYIDLTSSRASLFLPLLLLPLTELFFRAYAVYPLEKRYGLTLTYMILSLMYALSFGSPVLLLAGGGAILLAITNRLRSSAPAVVSQWVYYAGLMVVLLAVPVVRTWF